MLYEVAVGQTLDAAVPTKEQRDVTVPEEPAGVEKEMVSVNCFSSGSAEQGFAKGGIRGVPDEQRSTIESELTEVLDYIFDSEKPSNPADAINKVG